MSNEDIIRAWKDDDYWTSLDAHKRSQLPENPAGIIELTQTEMEVVAGGYQYPPSWIDRCPSALGCQLTRNSQFCI
jgi:mersacidin/lichenicidin family type 2 lantibiotic